MRLRVDSIRFKLTVLLSVVAVVCTGGIAYSLYKVRSQADDALVINLSGRQRALSQAISKAVLGLYKNSDVENGDAAMADYYLNEIKKKAKLFDDTLMSFVNGGVTMGGNGKPVMVPRAEDPAVREKLKTSLVVWKAFKENVDKVVAAEGRHGDPEVAAAVRYIEDNNIALFKDMNKLTYLFQKASDSKMANFNKFLTIGIIVTFLVVAAAIYYIHRLVIRRLHLLHDRMSAITDGDGDMTRRIEVINADEIGTLGLEFNKVLDRFEAMIAGGKESNTLFLDAAGRLDAAFSSISEGIREQEMRSSQVATALQEMNATVAEVARSASDMADAARGADEATRSGADAVKKVLDKMIDIADHTKEATKVISALGEESQEIGNIIQVINDIADQTNLLALNAAIEAARAGEQGRGFAVVADEVRKLAERTTKATKEIDEMITTIQERSRSAVESMDREARSVEEGVALNHDADSALADITRHIDGLTMMIQQIATATEEQSTAASSIFSDMESVSEVARRSAQGVEEMDVMARELTMIARRSVDSLSRFKVRGPAEVVADDDSDGGKGASVVELRARCELPERKTRALAR
ncbi:MAG TPA: HAMP domain-containing protein [Deltaproteobacteria bacterium]|nr:HAMP domain-containing protein [Deltaproteobacteria bacterium]